MVSGASIVAEQLAQAMADRGHEVLVIAASETGNPYIERTQNLTVIRLKSIRNPLRINQRVMFMQRRAVLQTLYNFKPDLIHVHEPVQMGLVGIKYAKHTNIPITMTSHQLPWFVASYLPDIPGLRAWMEKLIWKYARWLTEKYTILISPTKTISNIIKLHTGIRPKTINYGVELKTFNTDLCKNESLSVRTKFNIPANAPIILHTGRLDADKHADRVVLASESSIRKLGAHLLIAGDGCEKPALIKLCKLLGIENNVHFAGFISNKEALAGIYKSSNIFVTASEIETQGIVILEAAACGLPIVAVNATCVSEIVHHGCNGYLADPGDTLCMSKSIEEILRDTDLANSMSKQSCFISENYRPKVTFDEHEKLYHQMVRGPIFTGIWRSAKITRPDKKPGCSQK
jgi:glycosyltransferase involved in cell wall biosynthesis